MGFKSILVRDQWMLTIGSVTNSLAGWLLERNVLRTGAGIVGTFTCQRVMKDANEPDICPFGTQIVLYDQHKVPRFRGKRVIATGKISGPVELQTYRFADAWWDLEKRKYEQRWTLWLRNVMQTTSLQYYVPHVILNYGKTIAQEIKAIIDFAADPVAHPAPDMPVAIQAGTITCRIVQANPATEVQAPTDEVTCRDCASVLKQLFAFAPLNVPWLDYTTNPPTFNFQPAGTLPSVTALLTDLEDLDIEARDEDTAPGVIIHYERTDSVTVSGVTRERPVYFTDAFPPGITGREERAVCEVVTLAGFSRSVITADLTVSQFPDRLDNPSGFETVDALAFWKEKQLGLHLDDPRIKQSTLTIVPGSFSVAGAKSDEDEEDPPVDVDLENWLVAGQIAEWMTDDNGDPLRWQNIVLTIQFAYHEFSDVELAGGHDDAKAMGKITKFAHKIYLLSTNAPTGINTFSTEGPGEEGEQPPIGYAEFLYNQIKDPGYQGQQRRIQTECDGTVRMGKLLNVSGARPAFAAMQALIQSVNEDIDNGETTANFGVTQVFTPGLLMTLDRVHRMRRRWTGYTQQASGELS